MTKKLTRLLAVLAALALFVAACGDDDDTSTDDGTSDDGGGDEGAAGEGDGVVDIYGPEVDEAPSWETAIAIFEESSGIEMNYAGDKEFETQIVVRAEGGSPPDIGIIPQPGLLGTLVERGFVSPLPDDLVAAISENFAPEWAEFVTIDGEVYGVPVKNDVKSLVWYSPSAFADAGYEIPTNTEEYEALQAQMLADGNTPFCVGIESGVATGWAFTDWMERRVLHNIDDLGVYDGWVDNSLAFDDEQIVGVGESINEIWQNSDAVYAASGSIASTSFGDAGLGVLDGSCMMYEMANFYGTFWPDGTTIAEDGDVNVFRFPGSVDEDRLLVGGTFAAAFNDDPSTFAALEYMLSTDYVESRAADGGFLSAHLGQDISKYPTELEQTLAGFFTESDALRFDAADLMPAAIGAGEFWTAGTDIASGNKSVADAFAAVQSEFGSL